MQMYIFINMTVNSFSMDNKSLGRLFQDNSILKDVSYGESAQQRMGIYLPDDRTRASTGRQLISHSYGQPNYNLQSSRDAL